ncbi:outer membrane protein transport protein [Photobacterium sp. GSS17]|uniref:outer membrane protein transport protein n=1 Tax=Photobacterium sp. GSS17 TaxID=3020715 RepID=UPI00235E91E6|nr:outer membrane protein transport protein [Photobacterium sp. GSS17]
MSKRISITAIAVTAALFSLNTQAAGFQVNEHSASGLGRAFAGEVAIADNASVLARNPAAMARFKRMEFSGAISLIDPSIDISTVGSSPAQTYEDVAPFAAVPAGYFIQPINDKFAWGIGLFSNYGFATDYPTDANFGALAGKTELLTVNLNPNISWRINDQFSVGAGVSLVYADAELNRHFGSLGAVFGTSPSQTLINLNGDTWEWGWNVGMLWELNENHRFGLSYRSQVDLDFEGKFTDYLGSGVAGSTPGNPKTVDGKLSIPLPAIAEFGGFHQLTKQWAIHYGIQWTEWSEFTELKATSPDCVNNTCLFKDESFDDNTRYSIGATYTLNPEWTLRAGFAFDEQAGVATLSIPDTDRYWYSAGFTYTYNNDLSMDVGITYLYGKSSNFEEEYVDSREYEFRSENDAWLGAAQINYKF